MARMGTDEPESQPFRDGIARRKACELRLLELGESELIATKETRKSASLLRDLLPIRKAASNSGSNSLAPERAARDLASKPSLPTRRRVWRLGEHEQPTTAQGRHP